MAERELTAYAHKVQYYETDQMGIVHHSNYIRWFEEARTDILEQLGMGYHVMEEEGVLSPVLEAHAVYKSMTRYGETVIIRVKVKSYNGVTLTIVYEVTDQKSGTVRCIGETKHCFLKWDGKLLVLKKEKPEIHEIFQKFKESSENE